MDFHDLQQDASIAMRKFWSVRRRQLKTQGTASGQKDAGNRAAVTGGAQMDGFVHLIADVIHAAGVTKPCIYHQVRSSTYLPGFFRPTKKWDLIVVADQRLLACMEFKSQVGSFGNNSNNRAEEAIGNAHDFWTAYREGAFVKSPRPWLGYLVLLEDAPGSTSPVNVSEPHFNVFPEFKNASYEKRYEILCLKLVRERLYDSACLLMSDKSGGLRGKFREPNTEVGLATFAASLFAHASSHARLIGKGNHNERKRQ
ncbi:MAG: PaeR7I family type II restriction endonuclease [Planctomycetes bacterium]|nr:PaeR7I family type II restriction endonuclease [Planctomycetota bacterium]